MALLAGCGNGNPIIYDTISPTPSVTLDAGQSATFTATVNNDASNAGVTWSVGSVGTLSAATSKTVVYTAPATITAATTSFVTAMPVANTLYAASTQINLSPALAFTTTALSNGTLGAAYNASILTTGGSGTVSYSIASGTLPTGLLLSAAGTLSGTPTAVGSFTFTVQAQDTASTPVAATKTFTIVVTAPQLLIATASISNGVTGKAYSQQLNASGGIAPYVWTITSGSLPAGLTLSAAGLISGAPTVTGSFTITVQVTDTEATPQTATKSLSFTVYSALNITTTTLPGGSLKNAYSQSLAATGGTPSYTWSVASGTLPAGLTLSTAGVLSGTPTTAASYTFSVQVADNSSPQQVATQQYTVQIVTSTLAITTTTLANATTGVSYSATLASSGGNAPVTWSLASGSTLPANLTLSSAGVISGTATTAGTYSFTVQASDSTPYTVSKQLSLQVVALAALTISTTTVPSGNIGSAYSTTLAATGGASPYTWSITSGALPQGLTLSTAGVLSGTPLNAGSFSFTAQVKDSQATAATTSRSYTLAIGTALASGTNNALLNGPYAMLLRGQSNSVATGAMPGVALIGSLKADGAGNLSGELQTNASSGVTSVLATTGTYTLGADNRGLMVLTNTQGTFVYSIAASNVQSSIARSLAVSEFDNASGAAGTTNLTGFAKYQTAASFNAAGLKGTYAFGLSGESPCAACASGVKLGPLAAVGTLTSDGTAVLSAGAMDAGAYGTSYSGITFTGIYASNSSTTGRGAMHLVLTGTSFAGAPVDFVYYIVNGNEFLWMSSDSHASSALLAGDAQLQTVTSYTAATLTGSMIGYEAQAANGDGSTTLPSATNAVLTRVAFASSGTATVAQDANRAGTLTSTSAASATYTTATNGRTVLGSQVLYPFAANAGFALDPASTTSYPALITYEAQTATSTLPPVLSGTFGAFTLASPAPATLSSGDFAWTLSTGGVNTSLNGTLTTTLDSSSPAGALALGTSNSLIYLEDTNGRITLNANGSSTVVGVAYAITASRAVSITASTAATPVVSVSQQ